MEIHQLLLKNFRQFSNGEFSFSSGLNVVKGPNEAGKSTLHEAILVALFDRPTGKQRERKHLTWGQERLHDVKLTYRLPSGEQFEIHKDFELRTHEILGPNGQADTSRSGLKRAVQEALGTTSEKLFSSTVSIRQDTMMDLDKGGKEISVQMQEIAMGGVSGVNDAIDRLEGRVLELERGWKTHAPRNPGPISQFNTQIDELNEYIRTTAPEIETCEQAKEALFQQRTRIAAIENELEPYNEIRASYTLLQELKRDLNSHSQLEQELEVKIDRIKDAEDHKRQILERLKNLKHFNNQNRRKEHELKVAWAGYKARQVEVKDRENRFFELKKRQRDEMKHDKKAGPYWAIGMILSGAILGAISVLTLDGAYRTVLLLAGGTLALAGSLWLFGFVARRIRRSKNLEHLLKDAEEHRERGLKNLSLAQEVLQGLLGSFGCETWEEFENNLIRYKELQKDLEGAESTLAALEGGGNSLSMLEEQRKKASRARRDIQEELSAFEGKPEISAIEYQKICGEVERLEKERQGCQEQVIRLEALSQRGGSTLEDLHRSMERAAALQRRLENVLEKYMVYQMTLEGLREVRDQILKNAQHELEPLLGDYLGQLTKGRYARARVDEDLQVQISPHSKGNGFISMEDLSSGTRDQVYLAARLALCDMIFQDASPPILMDDPFIKFDPDRRDAALRLCKELSTNRQIILFTCHDGYDNYANRVISLG
jgi:uncharacterized protein YhaN